MDAYHKILVKIFEVTGGKETVDVDFVDLLKKEGYFPSLDQILAHLKSESWITESRDNKVRITHWGVAEAKKVGSVRPDAARVVERDARRLLAETRDFGVIIEEFLADPSADRFKVLAKKFAEMEAIVASLRSSR